MTDKILRSNLLIFFVGLTGAIYIKLFGTFAVAEPLLVFIVLLFVTFSRGLPRSFFYLLLVTLLWILGILTSDLYNGNDIFSTTKLIGSAVFILLNSLAFYLLLRSNHRGAVFFVFGNMISYLLQFYYFPPPLAKEDFASNFNDAEHVLFTWVAMTHYVSAMSFVGLIWFFGWRKISVLLLLIAAGGALFLGSRAYFLIGLISAAGLYSATRFYINGRMNQVRSLSLIKIAKVAALILLCVSAASLIYKEAAISGVLGDFAQAKYLEQSKIEGFGLASGRLDFFESLYAISRSPLVGFGSYAVDNEDIQADFYKLAKINSMESKELVPSHSHILGAWVWSGLLSLPFWILIIYRILKLLLAMSHPRLLGIVIPYGIFILWHIFFSPIGYRIDLSFVIGLTYALSKYNWCGTTFLTQTNIPLKQNKDSV